ncbi:cation diffusion facilitator family transporter [bacterium]|nr:cation diffusion facilitator family transporter [bacterium]MBU1638821.1 cation diffusion facilitator family transporter [bacterium]MBU1919897.1 cation diffusion facilitator family transporter [bacterium]
MTTKGFVSSENYRKRMRIAMISVIAAVVIAIVKFITAYLTNSLAMYAESGHSAVDGIAVLVAFIAIRHASKPPDLDHQYGHAKIESVAALFEIFLLLGFASLILYNAVIRFMAETVDLRIGWPAIAVMCGSLCIEGWRAFSMKKAAKQTGSEALEASSLHFMTDFLDSIAVIIGLVATTMGYPKADIFAALFVAGIILMLAYNLSKDVVSSLTDRAPAGVTEKVEETVSSVDGVIGIHAIRIRCAGSQMFMEMHVEMDAKLDLVRVHDILDEIERSVHALYPTMHIATHPEPKRSDA